MQKVTSETVYLDENDIKSAIRQYIIDKLGTQYSCKKQDIKIDASVSEDYEASDFKASVQFNEHTL